MTELRIHGLGGQGTVTLAHLLAQAALKYGKQAQALPSFGVERRGAPVKAVVRIADEPILVHSQSRAPDILVLMAKKLLDRGLAEGVKPDSIIVAGAAEPFAAGCPTYTVDAAGISTEEGLLSADGPFINVPILGAVARVVGIPFEVLEAVLREQWRGAAADKNVRVARRAYDAVTLSPTED